jgi:hypothetical protein
MRKWNVLPSPERLSAQMAPPIISTRFLEMASPRPVPPNCRVVDESVWVKLSKIFDSIFSGIPMPVSATLK